MDESTWRHLCAVALQERLTRLPDELAELLAEHLQRTYPGLSPREAADRLLESLGEE